MTRFPPKPLDVPVLTESSIPSTDGESTTLGLGRETQMASGLLWLFLREDYYCYEVILDNPKKPKAEYMLYTSLLKSFKNSMAVNEEQERFKCPWYDSVLESLQVTLSPWHLNTNQISTPPAFHNWGLRS